MSKKHKMVSSFTMCSPVKIANLILDFVLSISEILFRALASQNLNFILLKMMSIGYGM